MHFVTPNFNSAHPLLYKRASDIRALITDTLTIPLFLRTNSVRYCFDSNVSNASIGTLSSYWEVKGYDIKNSLPTAGLHKFSKTYYKPLPKFYASEGWREASSILRAHKCWAPQHKIQPPPLRSGARDLCTPGLDSHVPHNDVSVKDGPHIRRWSHNIIILWYLSLCCSCLQYSVQ